MWLGALADKLGQRKAATAYLNFLYSDAGQEIIARHFLRPRAKKYAGGFPAIQLFTIEEVFGSWKQVQARFFDDNGEFDRIFATR